jgi:hypothetical protein
LQVSAWADGGSVSEKTVYRALACVGKEMCKRDIGHPC